MVEMVSVNFLTLAFCKRFFCYSSYSSFENVDSIDDFKVVPLAAATQRIFNHNIQNSFVLPVNF